MDTGLLELTRRVTQARAELERDREPRDPDQCVIPGCKYTAPVGNKCAYHTGRDIHSRSAKPDYAVKFPNRAKVPAPRQLGHTR